MRQVVTLALLLVGLHRNISAQPWACLDTNALVYYTNPIHYLRGMKMDSITHHAGYLELHPYRSVRGIYRIPGPPSTPPKLDTNGASWMGKHIRVYPDGVWLFDNFLNDTVRIETKATTGSRWIFYSDAGSVWYEAVVSYSNLMKVKGSLDSVKYITIQAMTTAGPKLEDSMHNTQIILSKNNGLVVVPDLHMFPYHRPGLPYDSYEDYFLHYSGGKLAPNRFFTLLNDGIPMWSDIFDYHAGDALEHLNDAAVPAWKDKLTHIHDTILSRTDYPGYISYYTINTEFGISSHQYIFVQKAKTIGIPKTPVVNIPEQYPDKNCYYLDSEDSSWCVKSARFWFNNYGLTKDIVMPGLYYPFRGTYKVSVGAVSETQYYGDPGWDLYYLEWYSIGGQKCGNYTVVDVDDVEQEGAQVVTYPNPVRDELHIQSRQALKGNLYIYDVAGRLVAQTTIIGTHSGISLAGVSNGIYHASLVVESGAKQHFNITVTH